MVSKRNLEITIFILIIFSAIAFGYHKYIFSEQLSVIKSEKADLKQNQDILEELKGIINDKDVKIERIATLEKQVEKLDEAVPDTTNTSQDNLKLYYAMKERDLKINNYSQNVESKNGYNTQITSIKLGGKRGNVIDFINYLQENSRKYKISEATIRIQNVEDLDVTMKVETYFIKS